MLEKARNIFNHLLPSTLYRVRTELTLLSLLAIAVAFPGQVHNVTLNNECNFRVETRDGTLYVDPTKRTRFRIKGNEVALRLIGAFDTNESLYEELEEGSLVRFIALREIKSETGTTDYTSADIITAKSNGKIYWAFVYRGEAPQDASMSVLVTNIVGDQISCEGIGHKSANYLGLFGSGLKYKQKIVKIKSDLDVYKWLGL